MAIGARAAYDARVPTLRQLHYLVALADLKHFGRAAGAAHVSQPTLSQQLRALEQRLGVTLVERRLAGAELTPVGREIAERARRVLVGVEDIRALAGRAAEGAAGVIRLGVTPTLGPYLMPQIVAALHREQPDLRLYIREGIPGEQARELARGQLDMLLSPLPIAGEELAVEPLLRERLLLVAPEGHELAQRRRITRADLAGIPILSLDHRHHFHRQVARLCEEDGMILLRDYEGTSLDSVRQMVGSGLGFAILPDLYIRSEVGGRAGVAVLEVDGWTPWRSLAAAWRKGAAMSPTYLAIARRIEAAAAEIIAA